MNYKKKDDERCIICNRKLKRTGTRCSSCSNLFFDIKRKNPTKNDEELTELALTYLKPNIPRKRNTNGRKPKYLKQTVKS